MKSKLTRSMRLAVALVAAFFLLSACGNAPTPPSIKGGNYMKDIKITVADKKATLEGTPIIVCGNSDYTVTFSFDSEWSAMGPRTARFVYIKNGEKQHTDVVFSGATVAVPVLSDVAFVQVGVFEGNLATTTPARILCSPSILCGTGSTPDSLTEDVYNQLLALVVDLAERGAFGATAEQMQLVEQNAQNIAQLDRAKAGQEEVDVLAARMDTFTKLAEGSTTGDAELADIRISANGMTYETAGEAVRGQYTEVKQDLDSYLGATSYRNCSYTNAFDKNNGGNIANTYVNSTSGALIELSDCYATHKIFVGKSKYIYVPRGFEQGAFYDASDQFISGMSITSALNRETLVFGVPSGACYARFTVGAQRLDIAECYLDGYVPSTEPLLKELNNLFDKNNSDNREGYYVSNLNGSLVPMENQIASHKIFLGDASLLCVPLGFEQGAFYDVNGTFISGILIPSALNRDVLVFDIPVNACYARLTVGAQRLDIAECYANISKEVYESTMRFINMDNDVNIIHIGEGEAFTRLRDGISYACSIPNSTVYVHEGTYNLADEFSAELAENPTTRYGIALTNNVKVVFLAGSYVTAIVPLDNNVRNYFEPFYMEGSFELDGLNIEVSNTRYCVHDEGGGVIKAKTVYRNCVMKNHSEIYVDENNLQKCFYQCIGGGMGENHYVEIDNCYFDSMMGNDSDKAAVSYHNGYSGKCDGKIFVKNSYFANNNRLSVQWYGSSAIVSKLYANNNSFGKGISCVAETADSSLQNFEVIEWMNEVRN